MRENIERMRGKDKTRMKKTADPKEDRKRREKGQTLQAMGIKILIPVFFALFVLLTCLGIGLF